MKKLSKYLGFAINLWQYIHWKLWEVWFFNDVERSVNNLQIKKFPSRRWRDRFLSFITKQWNKYDIIKNEWLKMNGYSFKTHGDEYIQLIIISVYLDNIHVDFKTTGTSFRCYHLVSVCGHIYSKVMRRNFLVLNSFIFLWDHHFFPPAFHQDDLS